MQILDSCGVIIDLYLRATGVAQYDQAKRDSTGGILITV